MQKFRDGRPNASVKPSFTTQRQEKNNGHQPLFLSPSTLWHLAKWMRALIHCPIYANSWSNTLAESSNIKQPIIYWEFITCRTTTETKNHGTSTGFLHVWPSVDYDLSTSSKPRDHWPLALQPSNRCRRHL